MASGGEAAGRRVTVALAPAPGVAVEREVEIAADGTVGDVLAALGLPPGTSAGIWGRVANPATPVGEGDRVEVYRPLPVDAKEARRIRAARQRRAQKQKTTG